MLIHINEVILNEQGAIDPYKSDWVARLGGDWYARSSHGLFTVPKPLTTLGIGVDALPHSVQRSTVLTGNDLGLLGNLEKLPAPEDCRTARLQMASDDMTGVDANVTGDDANMTGDALRELGIDQKAPGEQQIQEQERVHRVAQKWIAMGKVREALALLMAEEASDH